MDKDTVKMCGGDEGKRKEKPSRILASEVVRGSDDRDIRFQVQSLKTWIHVVLTHATFDGRRAWCRNGFFSSCVLLTAFEHVCPFACLHV